MPPNNFTTSNVLITEDLGDSVANGTFPSSVQMVVTPDTGYAIQASDFFLGNDSPNWSFFPYHPPYVVSYAFNDSISALDPNNTVTLDIQLKQDFVFDGQGNNTQYGVGFNDLLQVIDIDGTAHPLTVTVHFAVAVFTNPQVSTTSSTTPRP